MSSRVAEEDRVLNVFALSNRATKQTDLQIHNISKENLQIGVSREQYIKEHKAEYIKEHGLPSNYKLTQHDKGQIAKLHDWGEYHKFKSCATGFAHYCRAEFGVKDIHDIKPEMASSFAVALGDLEYAKNTVVGYLTQVEKLGAFIGVDFHSNIQAFKKSADFKSLEEKDTKTRAFENPRAVIDALSSINSRADIAEKTTFSAHLAERYGLRISDCCHFRCVGNFQIFYNSKNGMKTSKTLSPQDYARAQALAGTDGKYNLSVNTLKDCVSRACATLGIQGSMHSFRHNFAQNAYSDLRAQGLTHKSACLVVSHEMNHSRAGITECYLR